MKPRIFLVDDDPTTIRLMQTLLEFEGYLVEPWDGHTGILSCLNQKQTDIVLMDVHLRELNGIDALKEIRQDPAFTDFPVIMTSGMDLTRVCMEAGATAFLMKPYMPESLLETIRSALTPEV